MEGVFVVDIVLFNFLDFAVELIQQILRLLDLLLLASPELLFF